MKRATEIAKFALLGGCIGLVLALSVAVAHADRAIVHADAELSKAAQHVTQVADQARDAIGDVRGAVQAVRADQEEHNKYLTLVLEPRVGNSFKALAELVRNTDCNLNGTAGRALEPGQRPCQRDGATRELAQAIHTNSYDVSKALAQTSALVGTLDQSAGPLLIEARDSLHEVGNLAGNQNIRIGIERMASAAGHVDEATGSLAAAAHDVQQAVHRSTRPASWVARGAGALLGLGSKLGQILAGFTK